MPKVIEHIVRKVCLLHLNGYVREQIADKNSNEKFIISGSERCHLCEK